MNRAAVWRRRLCPKSPFVPTELVIGPFDDQIQLDMRRTFSEVAWFKKHYEILRKILNTFSVINEGFGYPQGLNYLAYPLFYVFFNDNPETAVMDTLYSLQTLVQIVLPLYPLDAKDKNALIRIHQITRIVCLDCIENETKLNFLFDDDYVPFMTSLVSSIVPTLYANVFSLFDTIVIWDFLFKKKNLRHIFQQVVRVLTKAILFHKNIFIYLPIHSSMEVFQCALKHSVYICGN